MIIFQSVTPTNINQLYDELIAKIPAIRPTDEWQPLVIQGNDNFVQVVTNSSLPEEVVSQIQAIAQQHTPKTLPPPAQWDDFYQAHRSILLTLLSNSPNQTVAMALIGLFSRRRDPHFNRELRDLIEYWNLAVAPVLETSTIATLSQGISDYHLPVSLSPEGLLSELNTGES